MKSRSPIITEHVVRKLPQNRPPTHPGEMLWEEFVKPLDLTRTELAHKLNVSSSCLDEIIQGRRSITPDTALRLSQVVGMSVDFWLGLQQDWDLWQTMNSPKIAERKQLQAISKAS